MTGRTRDCFNPPPDGTPDREQYDRFRDFLTIVDGPADAEGRVEITDETFRYVRGEDVAPVPVDAVHPAVRTLRKAGRR
jgi:hypothetical protein